jgi:hypothetical protein
MAWKMAKKGVKKGKTGPVLQENRFFIKKIVRKGNHANG